MPRGCRQVYRVNRLIRSPTPKPTATWKSKIKWYSEKNHFKDINQIDGMPTEFERKIFTGITTLGLLEKIQSLMRDLQCESGHFKDRIIFMTLNGKQKVQNLHRQTRRIMESICRENYGKFLRIR